MFALDGMRTGEALEKPSAQLPVAYVSHLVWNLDLGGGVRGMENSSFPKPAHPKCQGAILLQCLSPGFLKASWVMTT